MATYLTFLLIRFGLVALALLLFTAALVLNRRGCLGARLSTRPHSVLPAARTPLYPVNDVLRCR
jgi:hypothetical protein